MKDQMVHCVNKFEFETDSWDLKAALESSKPIVVIDACSSETFEKEHIPDAINIPHRDMSPESIHSIKTSWPLHIATESVAMRSPEER